MNRTETKNPTKRILAMALSAVLAMGTMFALAGCGPNDEQVIRDGIAQSLDAFKNPTKENIGPFVGELDETTMKQLDAAGVDIYEFIEHAFRGFDYTIGDIKVDGDSATADVTVTTINVGKITASALEAIQKDEKAMEEVQKLYQDSGQKAAMQHLIAYIYDAMDASTETTTHDATLKLTKTDNLWDVDQSSMNELLSGMTNGLSM